MTSQSLSNFTELLAAIQKFDSDDDDIFMFIM